MASPAVQLAWNPAFRLGRHFPPAARQILLSSLRCALAPSLQRSWVFLFGRQTPASVSLLLDGAGYRVVSGAHASQGQNVCLDPDGRLMRILAQPAIDTIGRALTLDDLFRVTPCVPGLLLVLTHGCLMGD